ncbi:glucosamine-6-phosphate deaminase [Actinoallomurus rhizosphaericola]|uniref:glucosamine-6-phosphate deaminase n=1 Tax=Actinoallomurus rhizosphaericola TaxID=2952536 RepID=UPI002093CBB7|nr:glucosamine-6-phosphate deaminase [Actinoallomurus rhizosphaericola]MCO5995581.1 glucosamine-6-phosphate deaminase [Actinoallomurus rhizosphaericola]
MTEGQRPGAATYEPVLRRFPDAEALGSAAARDIAAAIARRLETRPEVRMIFAAAPSQEATLRALAEHPGVDWTRVTAFHMDEYLGLGSGAPQRFGTWLRRAFFDRVPLGAVHLIDPGAPPEAYARLLAAAPIDVTCLGIGVNGHLAFNDPPADLDDPAPVKIVELDEVCRRQQVDDGCFAALDQVPRRAITLTVPALLSAEEIFCMVPGARKREAVTAALRGPIGGHLPASALRTHPRCVVYVDEESAPR